MSVKWRNITMVVTLLTATACMEDHSRQQSQVLTTLAAADKTPATVAGKTRQLVIVNNRRSPPEIHPQVAVVKPSDSDQTTATAPALETTSNESPALARATITEQEQPSENDTAAVKANLLGATLEPGSLTRLAWHANQNFDGINTPVPVLVAKGKEDGPTLCLTAAVHGDELNGIEVVRRVLYNLNPTKLKGTVVGVPIVNLQGFSRNSRYLPDRRDLNRFFPGNTNGSAASRLAHSFFTEVILHCDALVDLHTGSFHRTNLPQIRADLNNPEVVKLTKGFGATLIMHNDGAEGTLRRAAVNAGIPAVTFEAGEPSRLQQKEVEHTVKAVNTLLDELGIYSKRSLWGAPEPVYYTSKWVRADSGGILFSSVKLGRRVDTGDLLGTITDPITNDRTEVFSPYQGRIIGMAVDQFVMPGFAAYHIGIETSVDEPLPEEEVDTEGVESEHAE